MSVDVVSVSQPLFTQVAQRFLRALERRDFIALAVALHPAIRFRALVPHAIREADGRSGTLAFLRRWFANADHFELLEAQIDHVADRLHIAYRVRIHDRDGWQVVEQHAFCELAGTRIVGLDVLCSGFRPVSARSAVRPAALPG